LAVRYQIVLDCHDPRQMVSFWGSVLGYQPESAPRGFAGWREYWKSVGVPEDELRAVTGPESIVDPKGEGPRLWFHAVPEEKICKNRMHFDIKASGGRNLSLAARRAQVETEVARLVKLGATRLETLESEGVDHYAVAMADPEGNEFDVN